MGPGPAGLSYGAGVRAAELGSGPQPEWGRLEPQQPLIHGAGSPVVSPTTFRLLPGLG